LAVLHPGTANFFQKILPQSTLLARWPAVLEKFFAANAQAAVLAWGTTNFY
jgi:hypothetical protein